MPNCDKPAVAKVTWPGNPPKYACPKHLKYAKVASKKFGVSIEVEEIAESDGKKCEQGL